MNKVQPYLENGIIYQINLRSFTNEGTLKAAEKLLPYVKSTGADIVYICPCVCSDKDPDNWSGRQVRSNIGNPQNPYRVSDYFNVDEEYGTNDDLKSFINTAHDNGLKVILDLVYYHCGPNAVFLKDHPDYVCHHPDGTLALGDWHFPKFDYDNPEVHEYLISNMEYYVTDFKVDGFRCDVADMVPFEFWQAARKRIDALNPNLMLFNEGSKLDYLQFFDLNYNWNLHNAFSKLLEPIDSVGIVNTIKELYTKDKNLGAWQYSDFIMNHDIVNDEYYNRLDKRAGVKAMDAAFVANYTLPYVPFIYCGSEIADTNRHSLYSSRNYAGNMTINWQNLILDEGKNRLELVKNLAELRHTEKAFGLTSALDFIDNDNPKVLTFVRERDGEKFAVIINYSDKEQSVNSEICAKDYCAKLVRDAALSINDGNLSAKLKGWGYAVVKL